MLESLRSDANATLLGDYAYRGGDPRAVRAQFIEWAKDSGIRAINKCRMLIGLILYMVLFGTTPLKSGASAPRKKNAFSERAAALVRMAGQKLKELQEQKPNFSVAAIVSSMPEVTLAVIAAGEGKNKPLPALLQLDLPESARLKVESVTEALIGRSCWRAGHGRSGSGKTGATREPHA